MAEQFLGPVWWLIFAVITTTILNVLIIVARRLHDEARLHDLTVSAHTLRRQIRMDAARCRVNEMSRAAAARASQPIRPALAEDEMSVVETVDDPKASPATSDSLSPDYRAAA